MAQCAIACTRDAWARDMCRTHLTRERRYGSPWPLTPVEWTTCECGSAFPRRRAPRPTPRCPSCRKRQSLDRSLDWAKANPERFKKQQQASYDRHRDARAEYVREWGKANPDRRLAAKARRRAREAIESEPIDRMTVFERDGWTCSLCSEPVDRDLAYPHTRSASLDHTIPLALGGPHTYGNVALAHLECNVRKGATV